VGTGAHSLFAARSVTTPALEGFVSSAPFESVSSQLGERIVKKYRASSPAFPYSLLPPHQPQLPAAAAHFHHHHLEFAHLFHHLLHLVELVEQRVQLGHAGATAGGGIPSTSLSDRPKQARFRP